MLLWLVQGRTQEKDVSRNVYSKKNFANIITCFTVCTARVKTWQATKGFTTNHFFFIIATKIMHLLRIFDIQNLRHCVFCSPPWHLHTLENLLCYEFCKRHLSTTLLGSLSAEKYRFAPAGVKLQSSEPVASAGQPTHPWRVELKLWSRLWSPVSGLVPPELWSMSLAPPELWSTYVSSSITALASGICF